jgi:hypothetical protein
MWGVAEMLLMKGWLETRWRLTALCVYLLLGLAVNYRDHGSAASNPRGMLTMLFMVLASFVMTLGGSGVKSQSPAGFPEGLAGSTQFTIALPVSRLRLLSVRAALGLGEAFAVTLIAACLTWILFPSVRTNIAAADYARLVAATLLFVTGPYGANVFFTTIVDEPLSFMYGGWSYLLLLWLLHRAGPAVDIVRAFTQSSPTITHQLPWSQMATCAALAVVLFWASARMVQTREY